MPVRGPLGVRRPFANEQLEINFSDKEIELVIRGPFGAKRVFAHPNPGVTDEEVAQCMQGRTANRFIKGLIENSPFPPRSLEEAQEWTEKYCRGTLESMKEEYGEDAIPLPEDLKGGQIVEGGNIEVEDSVGRLPEGE